MAFAGRPYVPSPLTLDHAWLKESLKRINTGMVEDGTAIGSAIGASARRLDKSEAKSKIIVLLTDGANNTGNLSPADAARLAKTLGIKIYPVAIGTPGLHFIPRLQRRIEQNFDLETLKEIAEVSGGSQYKAENTRALEEIFETIDKLEKTEIVRNRIVEAEDFFHLFLIPAVALAALSPILSQLLTRSYP